MLRYSVSKKSTLQKVLNWYNDYIRLLGEACFMKLKLDMFVLTLVFCFIVPSSLFALGHSAEDSLSRGKMLYADGRYDEAMDNFIDVFVSGNTDQITEANEYVNLIHLERGGVVAPKQIPYDAELERRQNIGVIGTDLVKKPTKDNEESETSKVAQEVAEEEEYEDDIEASDADIEENSFDSQEKIVKSNSKGVSQIQEQESDQEDMQEDFSEEELDDENFQEQEALSSEEASESEDQDLITAEEGYFPEGSKEEVLSLQREKEDQQRQILIDSLIAKLNANDDIQVYMRAGHIDAIDMSSSAIFKGNEINKNAVGVLDDVYALMILENSPSYVILPEGSYTDDVTLRGVQQAVALNSYFVNRGMSSSKMVLNMGLTTQEPPEKFSNLAGVSIVFDYKGKPNLKSKLQEGDLPPVLSLAVYPFKEIVPAKDEVFIIDFSVLEASAPIEWWVLQIVSHASDGHYYVVKQLSGEGPLNYQTFWNGRKRYFGHLLPLGKYTIVLRAKDVDGHERILKRQIILKEDSKEEETVAIKTETEVKKSDKVNAVKKETNDNGIASVSRRKEVKASKLDYSQKRLWSKPSRRKVGEISEEVSQDVNQSSTIVSTDSQKTVYKETTSDNSVTVATESEVSSGENSYGAVNNPYENSQGEEKSNPYEF